MTTTKTQPKPRRARRSMLFGLDRDQLLPLGLADVPKPVAEVNTRAHELFAKLDAAQATARAAQAEADAAPRHDQHAQVAAIAAGEDPPGEIAPAKRTKAEEAKRTVTAVETAAKQVVRELYDAMEDNLDEYRAARQKALAAAVAPLQTMVPAAVDLLEGLAVERGLNDAAAKFHNNPTSAAIALKSGDPRRAFERALAQQRQEKAQMGKRERTIANTLPDLLAAVELLLEEELA